MKGNSSIYAYGNDFFSFLFELKDDKDVIFRNNPYFFRARGLYLNKWSLDFDPTNDIPNVVLVWVKLPRLDLSCWSDDYLRAIGNGLGKYLDKAKPEGTQFACVKIYVEFDLEKGLPTEINLTMRDWKHSQVLDYEKLPFK